MAVRNAASAGTRGSRRALRARVLTVPSGMPSSCAASRVVSPSTTVARSTSRSSGEIRSRPCPRRRTPARPAPLLRGRHDAGRFVDDAFLAGPCALGVDQAARGDHPQPAAGLAPAMRGGRAPHGHERVLEHFPYRLRIGAATREADVQPARVPVVEHAERLRVPAGDRAQQRRVVPLSPRGAHRSHVFPIAPARAAGSRPAGPAGGASVLLYVRGRARRSRASSPQYRGGAGRAGQPDPSASARPALSRWRGRGTG